MTIHEIFQQLQTATNPVIKVLQKGETFKVILIGFKNGMVLKEHKASLPARLIVLQGKVEYRETEKKIVLQQYDETDIPMHVIHSVACLEDALCLLIQG